MPIFPITWQHFCIVNKLTFRQRTKKDYWNTLALTEFDRFPMSYTEWFTPSSSESFRKWTCSNLNVIKLVGHFVELELAFALNFLYSIWRLQSGQSVIIIAHTIIIYNILSWTVVLFFTALYTSQDHIINNSIIYE